MAEFRFEQDFSVSQGKVLAALASPDYSKNLANSGGSATRELVREQEHEGRVRRTVRVAMAVDLPGPLKRALSKAMGSSDRIEYLEHAEHDFSAGRSRWQVEVPALGERIQAQGTMSVEPLDDSRCRRVMSGTVKARILGVGKVLEKLVVDGIERGFERANRVVDEMVER